PAVLAAHFEQRRRATGTARVSSCSDRAPWHGGSGSGGAMNGKPRSARRSAAALASSAAPETSPLPLNRSSQKQTSISASRRAAEEWMLMMQGMAGIRPEDSKWVASKLFEGFAPAPMPCCGPPGAKKAEEEHQCCERQRAMQAEALHAREGAAAFERYRRQFGLVPGGSAP